MLLQARRAGDRWETSWGEEGEGPGKCVLMNVR